MPNAMFDISQATALSIAGIMLIAGAIGVSLFSIYKGMPLSDAVNSTMSWVTMGLACLGINFGYRITKAFECYKQNKE